MLTFILRRLLWAIPVLWVVATLTFLIMHIVPGGPFDKEKKLPPEIKANVEAKYHLDQPLSRQYLLYIEGLLRGDLGPSYKYLGRTVNDVIADTFPVSMQLGFLALSFALIFGLIAGILSSVTAHTLWDRASMFFATAGVSTPNFVLGALLIYFFSHRYKIFPPALWEDPRHAVLPAIALGLAPAAYIARLARSSILETNRQDYVRTARSKGLSETAILFRHILKNAITPVVTILGPLTATLVTGSFVVEFIFSVPGMGKYFITAVTNRDYPLIMGVTLLYAVLIVIANLLVDLLYTLIDPRVRLE
ncbi:MAG: ABC transporter permease [Nitrospirae bacterium]|nr:ABC transporter permease [Candidatus Manganitrophaceae bacterium]